MKTLRSTPLSAAIALLVFGSGLGPVSAQAAGTSAYPPFASNAAATRGASHFVRIPADGVRSLSRLELSPRFTADYGSFRWMELSDSDYWRMAALGSLAAEEKEAGQIQINRFRFDPVADGVPPTGARLDSEGVGPGFHLVQFRGPVKAEWLSELETAGLEPLQYYPSNTYLVWGEPGSLARTENLPFVRWQGRVQPAYKPSQSLDGRAGMIHNVDVMFYGEKQVDSTLASIEKAGGRVLRHYPSQPDRKFFNAIVEMPADAIEAMTEIDTVLWLGFQDSRPILDDEMSAQIQAGNHPGGVPAVGYENHLVNLGFDGTGVTWAITDTGIDYDHPDLIGNIVGGYSFPGACNPAGQPGSDCAGGGHGTHVAGIVAGDASLGLTDANGFLYGLGVAPGAGLYAMNSLSASAWPPAGGWQEHSKRAILGGAIGTNNSWTTGEGTNHGYQASERTHDIMARDGNFDTAGVAEPFIQVFSAGNSGTSGLTAPKEAKNIIVTASSVNYRAGNIENISSFSSRGPAADGRQVPTIAAPGEQIASARNDDGGSCTGSGSDIPGTGTPARYSFCSGTSMASPHVAGAVVLATEWWRSFHAGANPSPAMAKALLVNNAVDMAGNTSARWNTLEGWGRVNITNTLQPGVPAEFWDQTQTLTATGQTHQITLGVSDPAKPVKITLAWTDAPGAAGANPALVNNLDLSVTDGASTYLGNVFTGGWSATGGSADTRNNLENVFIQNPSGGALTITVAATNLAGDGVPNNATPTDQDFALICTNCALSADFTQSVTPSSLSVCAPTAADYTVNIGSILGYNTPVTLSVSGNPAGTTASFSTNPVTPAGTSTLSIGGTGSAAAGSYTFDVIGDAGSGPKTTSVGLNLFSAAPAAGTLTAPGNGAANVPVVPTFSWNAVAQAAGYDIEVATDAAFTTVVASGSGLSGTSWTPGAPLNTSTTYYWRVRASNTCGTGGWSSASSFTTVAAPGDCGPGTVANVLMTETFESGLGSWTTPAGTGTNTWAISTANPNAGAQHVRGVNTASVTVQSLVSPAVALPSGQNPVVLKFNHVPNLENSGTTACYDGGILEVSSNGGSTWTQVPNANLLVGPYVGAVSGSFSNPLAGLQAWCSATTTTYRQTIADVSSYAGQSVQFRWRIGTDTSVGRPGWDVDNVSVQSCQTVAGGTPNADVSPASLTSTQAAGSTTTQTLNVGNTGTATLNWSVVEDSGAGCAAPADVPWLSASPTSGATPVSGSAGVTVTLDATSLAAGSYSANLCVNSDDPDAGPGNGTAQVVVPVSLTVTTPVLEPVINVTPASLSSTQATNVTTTQTLNVGNTGTADLNWTIAEDASRNLPKMPAAVRTAQSASENVGSPSPAAQATGRIESGAWMAPMATLHDNGGLVTNPGAGTGGADVSALQLTNTTLGSNVSQAGPFRLADDFTVPAGGWTVDKVTVFAYQTGSTTTSTITGVNLRIWDGVPGAAGSSIVFGDDSTNRLESTAFTNIYRTSGTDLTNTQRPVMAVVATVGTTLAAGTYWVDWQLSGSLGSGPWAPAVTLAGQTNAPGANAVQYVGSTSTWQAVVDTGSSAPQDFPFVVEGSAAQCASPTDIPWLTLSSTSGTTAAGGNVPVTVTFDSTGLANGGYAGNLCIASNDAATPLVVVPVSLTVDTPLPPAIFSDGFE
mgnify:CR=1 FL=1